MNFLLYRFCFKCILTEKKEEFGVRISPQLILNAITRCQHCRVIYCKLAKDDAFFEIFHQ